jgi:flavorubredoxin
MEEASLGARHIAKWVDLRPRFASIIGSYGWGGRTVETLAGMIGNHKVEVIELCKGRPGHETFGALDGLARTIAGKHMGQGFAWTRAPSIESWR